MLEDVSILLAMSLSWSVAYKQSNLELDRDTGKRRGNVELSRIRFVALPLTVTSHMLLS